MELMDLILALVSKFTPIDPTKLAVISNEALKWRSKIQEDPVEKEKPINKFYLKINEPWWMRLLWAVAYVPIVKWMQTPERVGNENDEEM
jgi:hypothetical protein